MRDQRLAIADSASQPKLDALVTAVGTPPSSRKRYTRRVPASSIEPNKRARIALPDEPVDGAVPVFRDAHRGAGGAIEDHEPCTIRVEPLRCAAA